MINFENVTKVHSNGVKALDNVSFNVDKGEFVFLIGSSGAGKSTLISLVFKETEVTEGTIEVNGFRVNGLPRKKVPYLRRGIGIVFQDYRLLPNKSVYENVAFTLEITGATPRHIRRKVSEVLNLVDLEVKATMMPYELSGGEQQRVALARAMVSNPSIIIADEPTGNLDPDTAFDIMQLLDNINKKGTTILVATHAERLVNIMRKRVLSIENGVMVKDQKKGVYEV